MRRAGRLLASRLQAKQEAQKAKLSHRLWSVLRGDRVEVLAGKAAGTITTVKRVLRRENRVQLHGANLVKRHVPRRLTGENAGRILTLEAPIHASNVRPVDPATDRGTRTRNAFTPSAERVRIAARTGTVIPRPEELAKRQTQRPAPGGRHDTPSPEVHRTTFDASSGGDIPWQIPEWPGTGKDPSFRRKRQTERYLRPHERQRERRGRRS